ncbi:hypothetical protein K492DRAFT_234136 [Lichtheimia hyalospora FSU 10163]|nr:hypothetical protein K492DRAFT_234136 [Lichtheimia hyalospora FSU 10163]
MEGLAVGSIPRVLLARILLQLYVIPQHYLDNPGDSLIRILVAGLQQYGETSDLDGLLQFCLHQAQSLNNTPNASTNESGLSSGPTLAQLDSWWWKDLAVSSLQDWDRLDLAYPVDKSEPVNLHIQILSEEARRGAVQIKYAKDVASLQDKRLFYYHEKAPIPIDSILCGTMKYLEGRHPGPESSSTSSSQLAGLGQLVEKRLEQFARDRFKQKQHLEQHRRVAADYNLMGALMRRYDDSMQAVHGGEQWCLYIRDYIYNDAGTVWRIISEAKAHGDSKPAETRIHSSQALADIRGVTTPTDDGSGVLEPSDQSRVYRPIYLFYSNRELVEQSLHGNTLATTTDNPPTEQQGGGVITMEDYLLDEDVEYGDDMEVDDTVCKVCQIPDIIDNINNMFYCDNCNLGIHQLCAEPPIANYEVDIDPWYCRECCRDKGLPIPPPQPSIHTTPFQDQLGIKRKREEDNI